jgi:hypothetical protein
MKIEQSIMIEDNETQLSSISRADSYEAIGEFWDTHSSADYWDQGYDVEFEIRVPRRHSVNIEAEAFERIATEAQQRGVTSEMLINLWVAERLRSLKTWSGLLVGTAARSLLSTAAAELSRCLRWWRG